MPNLSTGSALGLDRWTTCHMVLVEGAAAPKTLLTATASSRIILLRNIVFGERFIDAS